MTESSLKPGLDWIGVSVSFWCHDGQGRILMGKRSQNCRDEIGSWETGGGQVEFGEELEETVLREVFEEYGAVGQINQALPAFTLLRTNNGRQSHWVNHPYLVRVEPRDVKISDPHSIEEIGWFSLTNLPTPLHSAVRWALEANLDQLQAIIGQSNAKSRSSSAH